MKEIVSVTIVQQPGSTDRVCLHTDLPSPFPSSIDSGGKLTLYFEAPRGTGLEYVRDHFGDTLPWSLVGS